MLPIQRNMPELSGLVSLATEVNMLNITIRKPKSTLDAFKLLLGLRF